MRPCAKLGNIGTMREDQRARLDVRLAWERLLDSLPVDWVKPEQRTDFEDWIDATDDDVIALHRRTRELQKITEHYIPLTADSEAVRSFAVDCVERVRSTIAELPGKADELTLKHYLASLSIEYKGIARALDPSWWRRSLDAVLDVRTEQAARELRAVGGRVRYISQQTETRKESQRRANKNAVDAATIEPKGKPQDHRPLRECVDASVSNPPLRRAELMVRIGGADDFAIDAGHVGLFFTLTLPSEYHHVKFNGQVNDKWTKKSTRDGHERLMQAWRLTRATLDKERIDRYGLRVVEPHVSGTAHWHILLWCAPVDVTRICEVFRDKFIVASDAALFAHGMDVERIDKKRGGAKAYLAKYVSKNIDGEGLGGERKSGAKRVRHWASAHRIKQFQFFGLPPVGTWREIRKLTDDDVNDAPIQLRLAFAATNKDKETGKVDFHKFIRANGGCGSRRFRPITVARASSLVPNKYLEHRAPGTVGINCDWWQKITRAVDWVIKWTSQAWTRGNNCNRAITTPQVGAELFSTDSWFDSAFFSSQLRPEVPP